jgi:hypothetical protein
MVSLLEVSFLVRNNPAGLLICLLRNHTCVLSIRKILLGHLTGELSAVNSCLLKTLNRYIVLLKLL